MLDLGLRRLTLSPRRRVLGIAALALALLGGADGAEPTLRIVATLPDLFVLTHALAGDVATVDVIARFGQNPHDMEVRPSHMALVRRADALVRNGLEEDAWIDVIVEGSANPKVLRGSPNVIDASTGIEVLKVASGRVDRSMGDVHPLGSPHYTLDPANVAIVTTNIALGLARVAPGHAAAFEAGRLQFLARLAEADRRWKAVLAPFRGEKIVSYHDSWPYFYRAFGLVEGGIIEDRPGIPPSPRHLALLIHRMKEERVRVILRETWYPPAAASLVAEKTGAKVLAMPQTPGAVPGTEDYIAHLDYLVTTLAAALR